MYISVFVSVTELANELHIRPLAASEEHWHSSKVLEE